MPRKAIAPPPRREPPLTYGCKVTGRDQLWYDRWAFAWHIPVDAGAPPRDVLFRRISDRLAPGWLEWHPWTQKAVVGLTGNKYVGLCGCAHAAKTRNVVGYACNWWLSAPAESSVIFCSTTAKSLRKRGWAQVQNFHTSVPGPRLGNFVDSRMMWQCQKGDDLHAIFGIAVEEGETNKIADNIKGIHTKRQLVIIDEATAVPPAIMEACTNLKLGPVEFVLVLIGNPRGRLDQFGLFVEPVGGWQSVTVNDEEWEIGPPRVDGRPVDTVGGVCLRFDIEKSPNLDYPEDKPISRYLPSRAHVDQVRSNLAYHDSPSYWSNERGFPPPDGMAKTIFSETSISNFGGRDKHQFTGDEFKIIGFFDHARDGGDRPTCRFAAMGEIQNGKIGIELLPPVDIPINVSSNNPIDFQIVEQLKRQCENVNYRGQKHACDPINFGIDGTGGGADLCDIAQRIWSPNIIRVLFSGAATTDACSLEDVRPANEVYGNLRAEMYFRAGNALESGQLKGIDKETEKELCAIEFNNDKKLTYMMKKRDYRNKFRKSPDWADTGVGCVEIARRRGFSLAAVGHTVHRDQEFKEQYEQSQAVHLELNYHEEEMDDAATFDEIGAM